MSDLKPMAIDKEAAVESQAAALNAMRAQVTREYDDAMGVLHNQIQSFVSLSGLPLPCIVTVLQMLLQEAMEIAFKRYFGEGK